MAENENVQLKREEVVDQEVVLSDIFPNTNTGSVVDDVTGASLNRTLERVLNAINNKLARVVNSVNGRTGVVVLDKGDVNLDNVDNVSFDDIKRWVLEQLKKAFDKHTIKLFNNLHEAVEFGENHDETYSGTAFFSDNGFVDSSVAYEDKRSYIGYYEYNEGTHSLLMYYHAINTIGGTDNSIIYNTQIAGKGDFRGGKIGVNIYKYEDALKLYRHASGETATDYSLQNDGLYIDKNKIAPMLYFYDGCYGNGDSTDYNALLYFDELQQPGAVGITINLNGNQLCSAFDTFTRQTFKVNDLIICNFNDTNCYDSLNDVKGGIRPGLLLRQPAIGKVDQAPSVGDQQTTSTYIINFYTLKPLLGNGLVYLPNHTETGEVVDSMLSISHLKGSPLENPQSSDIYDISGLVSFNSNARDENGSKPNLGYIMSTASGWKSVIHGDANSGLAVNPSASMCVVPSDQSKMNLTNFPINTPPNTTDGPGRNIGGYVAVNLVKSLSGPVSNPTSATNISGLRINNAADELNAAWFGNPDLSSSFSLQDHSGGLSVNVGDFLEIGKSWNDILPSEPVPMSNYYDMGKVNVRIDENSLTNVGNNKLGVNLSHYTNYGRSDVNECLGGGIVHTPGYQQTGSPLSISDGLTINRGLGLKMSHYDRFGVMPPEYNYTGLSVEPEDWGTESSSYPYTSSKYFVQSGNTYAAVEFDSDGLLPPTITPTFTAGIYFTRTENVIEDRGFLAVSVFDKKKDVSEADFDPMSDQEQKMGYGGLRYLISNASGTHQTSAIGLRVNELDSDYGHELRLGSRAIGINEQNIVGVQLYRESDNPSKDVNPLNIKGWNEYALYKYIQMPWMTNVLIANTYEDLVRGIFINVEHAYRYTFISQEWIQPDPHDPTYLLWPNGAGTYYTRKTVYKRVKIEPNPFDPTQYWKSDGQGGYTRGSSEDTWASNTWYEQAYAHIPFDVVETSDPHDCYNPMPYPDYYDKSYMRTDITPDYGHRTDITYLVLEDSVDNESASRRYIWNPTTSEYEPMFLYYSVDLENGQGGGHGAPPLVGDKNKAYVVYDVDNTNHTIIGKLYQWAEQNRVELPMAYDETTGTYNDNKSDAVNAVTASAILSFYVAKQTGTVYKGYYDEDTGKFYEDVAHQTEMEKQIGILYEDITLPEPHMLYSYTGAVFVPYNFGYGSNYSLQDFLPLDFNKDGHIDAMDASIALDFYANYSAGKRAWPDSFKNRIPAPTIREYLSYYIENIIGITYTLLTTKPEPFDPTKYYKKLADGTYVQGSVSDSWDSYEWYEGYRKIYINDTARYITMRETDPNGSFIPGLDIDVNEYQGMTTNLNGDIKKSASVKIFDNSAGCDMDASDARFKLGGLRFTTGGYLSVRVNELHEYNAVTPDGRTGHDQQANYTSGDHGTIDQNIGSRGLMVYPNNVLGVQLSHDNRSDMMDNGELCIDQYGSLHISPSFNGGGGGYGETLTFVDAGGHQITYNGSSPQTITLGPGLIIEND